jgi:hypothetical protein
MEEAKQEIRVLSPKEQNELPTEVRDWVLRHKSKPGVHRFEWEGHKYVLVSIGMRPNPGYRVEVIKVENGENGTTVLVEEKTPQPGMLYPQIVSYPYLLAESENAVQIGMIQPNQQLKMLRVNP